MRSVLYAIALSTVAQAEQNVCRALVLSGGASLGAWEAGILYGIATNAENPEDFHYDVVTGISAGAINAAGLAPFAPEELMESAQFLSDTWAGLYNREIWSLWPYEGPILGCLKEHGCLDDGPALNFLDQTLSQFPDGYKRRVTLASVDVNTGDFIRFNQDNTDFADLHMRALASGSIPGVFPPQLLDDMVLMDGGTDNDVNLISAIEQCLEIVDDESQIVMDIAICGSRPDNAFTPKKDAAMNFVDSRELRFFANGMNAINWQQRAYPQVQYRYLFYEELFLPIFELLDFNNSTTWKLQESGRQQAKETMEMGEGIGFIALESWLEDEKNLREEYGSFMKYMRSFAAAIF